MPSELIPNQLNPIQILASYFSLRTIFILPFLFGLPSGIFLRGFPTKNARMFNFPMRCACPAHLILPGLIALKYYAKNGPTHHEALPWINNYISSQKEKQMKDC
jgi:hypothetical protein